MPKPVVFDDISKDAEDVLNDDYFVGNKTAMKIKHIQGVNITAEAKAAAGKPVLTKISSDFTPCKYFNVKKVSIDTTGAIVGDFDFTKLLNNTTFTMRTIKNYNEAGMKKAAFGAKIMTEGMALNTSYEAVNKKYDASLVCGYGNALLGAKLSGTVSGATVTDIAASYKYNSIICSCTGYDLFKKTSLAMYYELNDKTRLATVCDITSMDKLPQMTAGIASKIADNTEVRAKVNNKGEIFGCYKTTVDKKITFTGSFCVDMMNLNGGNHKVGFGCEFLF